MTTTPALAPTPAGRFLSRDESTALAARAVQYARGGGRTSLFVRSEWTGNVRWARNEISTCGDIRDNTISVRREIRGARGRATTNQIDDTHLEAATRRAERLLLSESEQFDAPLQKPYVEPYPEPNLWFDRTYQLDAAARANVVHGLVGPARQAGLLSAGYIQVSAVGMGILNYSERSIYHPATYAQYSVTVRHPDGTASGWAGVDHSDWGRIDTAALSAVAMEKCLASRNPVAVEPGRYTVVLEPQAVWGLVAPIIMNALGRDDAERSPDRSPPFSLPQWGQSKIGERIMDARITMGADPADPEMGFLPVGLGGEVFHAVDWIKDGVLRELEYYRDPYGIRRLGLNTGLPSSGALRMSGGTTTIEEMIATTERGILVTRFSGVSLVDGSSLLSTGFTRDGTWLIEHGKISKPIKNLRFTESPLFVLNRVDQLGVPKRVFNPDAPVVVPPLKAHDFSFTAMSNAI